MSTEKKRPHWVQLFVQDMTAGGVSGIVAKTCSAPIERVKLLLQTQHVNRDLQRKYMGITDCISRVYREQGLASFWRGNVANLLRYFSSQALLLFFFAICLTSSFAAPSSTSSVDVLQWEVLTPADASTHSFGFQSRVLNYTCPIVACSRSNNHNSNSSSSLLSEGKGLLHFVASVEHKSNFPLLVYRVCDALQWCMSRSDFYITLHYHQQTSSSDTSGIGSSEPPRAYRPSLAFLHSLGISVDTWTGSFTANTKMMRYLENLKDQKSNSKLLFHLDLDEFPDVLEMQAALAELETGTCDYVKGVWADRISRSGHINHIKIGGQIGDKRSSSGQVSLQEQFPLRCNFSKHFMPARVTVKVLNFKLSFLI